MSTPTALAKVEPRRELATVAAARADIETARKKVMARIEATRVELKKVTDWRAVARRHPVATTLGAVAIGFVVARVFGRR